MAVAGVAYWRFKPGQRERGKGMRDEVGEMVSYPGVLGTIWLDSQEDPDASLTFVIIENRGARSERQGFAFPGRAEVARGGCRTTPAGAPHVRCRPHPSRRYSGQGR